MPFCEDILLSEVEKLLLIAAVEEVPEYLELSFIPGTFWCRKWMGKFHSILDLGNLNKYIRTFKFHVLTFGLRNPFTFGHGFICDSRFKGHVFSYIDSSHLV